MQLSLILAPVMEFLKKNWQYILFFFLAFMAARKLIAGFGSGGYTAPVNDTKATISDSDARQYADGLLVAMDQWGTDQDYITMVWNSLNGNVENLKKVYNAFGKKDYGVVGAASWFTPSTSLSLYGWLKTEVTDANWSYWSSFFRSAGIYS